MTSGLQIIHEKSYHQPSAPGRDQLKNPVISYCESDGVQGAHTVAQNLMHGEKQTGNK